MGDTLSTKATLEEISSCAEDEYGVVYSQDGKRLLKCKKDNIHDYTVKCDTKVICDQAFWSSQLDTINLPIGLTTIGEYAFSNCCELYSVDMPDSVTAIGGWAFRDCLALKSIRLPKGLKEIGFKLFVGCENLISVEIPENVISIDRYAFSCCRRLNSIKLPDSVAAIGDGAFECCDSLSSIELPCSLKSIGTMAFWGCFALTKIYITYSRTDMKSDIEECRSLIRKQLPRELMYRVFFGRLFEYKQREIH
ncbi:MAG: leucine-rich repeat domain-containing protein [Prevotella sp.]|nr:leucine-rich repeat domain-containing protein [Prevotella sp.]